nr:MAG TPA: hypothetical protein [Caudoviricetes sp.]
MAGEYELFGRFKGNKSVSFIISGVTVPTGFDSRQRL